MKRSRFVTSVIGLFALALVMATPVRAQDDKEHTELEAFRAQLAGFLVPLADTTRLMIRALEGLPEARLEAAVTIASFDAAEVQQSIAALSHDHLRELRRQFDQVPGWQNAGAILTNAISPEMRSRLTALTPGDRPFGDTNGLAEALCGLVEGIDLADSMQAKQQFSIAALAIYETLEAIAIPFDVACDASPCSVAFFDLPIVGPLKVALCGVATATRIAATVARALVDASRDCSTWTFNNGIQQRIDARLSSLASIDSTGTRTGIEFDAESIHEKLEDRLDVVTTTRSTQDSIDGQRGGRPPSPAKSVRTVVDHADGVLLPEIERSLDETLELAKQQGELMRDFRDLLIRMQIETDLTVRGRLREAMFQLPENIPGHKRAFCQRDITIPCIAAGPDLTLGTDDDLPDASLCPDDSQPAEVCDLDSGVCSRTRANPCAMDSDCPSGETCDFTSHPCSASRDRECSFDEDCPTGRPAQICVAADRQRGYLALVRQIVVEAIDMTVASGEQIRRANDHLAAADALLAGGDYKNAYSRLRFAYQEAARLRQGH